MQYSKSAKNDINHARSILVHAACNDTTWIENLEELIQVYPHAAQCIA